MKDYIASFSVVVYDAVPLSEAFNVKKQAGFTDSLLEEIVCQTPKEAVEHFQKEYSFNPKETNVTVDGRIFSEGPLMKLYANGTYKPADEKQIAKWRAGKCDLKHISYYLRISKIELYSLTKSQAVDVVGQFTSESSVLNTNTKGAAEETN